ncbi:c-type cytochrome [Sphingomonas sp.]|uniref:c-type cytochrome n=1 Tax=Sphingomonas sp. TaxID=28214 RepID=UPI000DB6FE69|nr:c-type cytochrome [Sphingomonas sp.]PZU11785.1 MAG: aldehyde dehydrogenase [Sphingomonas sp.]
MKRILTVLAAVILLGLAGFGILAWRSAIAPVERPAPASFSPQLVQQGAILAAAGYCSTCHTARGGQPFAGGYAMATQFGTIYSTNITPDVETGIGDWSEAAFRRAMREGVARDGSHLFPAFPFDHFNKLTDGDIAALYAFLMTQPAVKAPARANTVPFPLNIRALQAGWKLLFFHPGPFQPDPAKGAAWNRGAYLAEGISHCGACHTPRNPLGAEKRDKPFAGAAIDNWVAPALDRTNAAPVPWNKAELTTYLGTGVSRYHGTAAGPMAPVVHGLAQLPPSDLDAIATYFGELNGTAGKALDPAPAVAKALAAGKTGTGLTYDPAARLYAAACASCHYNGADTVNPLRPELALNNALTLDDPTNLIQVVLHGIDAKDGAPGVVMPAFSRFSDADVARIAAWLRATRTGKAPWPDLEKKVAAIRAQAEQGE